MNEPIVFPEKIVSSKRKMGEKKYFLTTTTILLGPHRKLNVKETCSMYITLHNGRVII